MAARARPDSQPGSRFVDTPDHGTAEAGEARAALLHALLAQILQLYRIEFYA